MWLTSFRKGVDCTLSRINKNYIIFLPTPYQSLKRQLIFFNKKKLVTRLLIAHFGFFFILKKNLIQHDFHLYPSERALINFTVYSWYVWF